VTCKATAGVKDKLASINGGYGIIFWKEAVNAMAETMTEKIYRSVRDEIINQRIKPGGKLSEAMCPHITNIINAIEQTLKKTGARANAQNGSPDVK
jgi:hypothetical protein